MGWLIDLDTKDKNPRTLVLGKPIPCDESLPTPAKIRHAVTLLTTGKNLYIEEL